jgi:hypothetical protein
MKAQGGAWFLKKPRDPFHIFDHFLNAQGLLVVGDQSLGFGAPLTGIIKLLSTCLRGTSSI